MKKTTPATPKVLSFAEIHKLCTEVKTIKLVIDDQECQVKFRRLTAGERQVLESITDEVMPPVTKGATPEQDRIEYTGEFIKKKTAANVKIRALAIYWCVPEVREMKPDLKDHDAIVKFIQDSFPSDILVALERAVSGSGMTIAELVNFTSSSGSPES